MNFQIFISFYSLVKFTVNIRADKISNKYLAENSTEVSRELPLISRAHQTAKNYNRLLCLMEAQ